MGGVDRIWREELLASRALSCSFIALLGFCTGIQVAIRSLVLICKDFAQQVFAALQASLCYLKDLA